MRELVINMENISKTYELSPGITTRVLKGIDLDIEEGEFVSIMGPSGSGKSTLMNLLGILDRPSGGTYILGGHDVGSLPESEQAGARNRLIGFVFQGFNLLPRRSIIENIALPMFYAGMDKKERTERAEYYLNVVGLSTHRNYVPTQLSGGQQQRIAIARALSIQPKLILADEPTGNLDSVTSKEIMELFKQLNKDGITIVLVTHEQRIAQYAQRLVQIKDGDIIYDGAMY